MTRHRLATPARLGAALTVFLVTALSASPAFAHVGVDVDDNRPGARARYTVSVPNESETADTVEVAVELPEGLDVVRVEPPPTWDMVERDGVLTISGGSLPPGGSQDFLFVAFNPPQRGEVAFPALQTYSDGEVVRWTGEPDSDQPAPVVTYEGQPVPRPTPPTDPRVTPPPPPSPEATATETQTQPTTAAPSPTQPTAAAAATPAAERDTADAGPPVWLLVLLAIAVLVVLGAAAWRRRPDEGS